MESPEPPDGKVDKISYIGGIGHVGDFRLDLGPRLLRYLVPGGEELLLSPGTDDNLSPLRGLPLPPISV